MYEYTGNYLNLEFQIYLKFIKIFRTLLILDDYFKSSDKQIGIIL